VNNPDSTSNYISGWTTEPASINIHLAGDRIFLNPIQADLGETIFFLSFLSRDNWMDFLVKR
jgi:hypothetical protein